MDIADTFLFSLVFYSIFLYDLILVLFKINLTSYADCTAHIILH